MEMTEHTTLQAGNARGETPDRKGEQPTELQTALTRLSTQVADTDRRLGAAIQDLQGRLSRMGEQAKSGAGGQSDGNELICNTGFTRLEAQVLALAERLEETKNTLVAQQQSHGQSATLADAVAATTSAASLEAAASSTAAALEAAATQTSAIEATGDDARVSAAGDFTAPETVQAAASESLEELYGTIRAHLNAGPELVQQGLVQQISAQQDAAPQDVAQNGAPDPAQNGAQDPADDTAPASFEPVSDAEQSHGQNTDQALLATARAAQHQSSAPVYRTVDTAGFVAAYRSLHGGESTDDGVVEQEKDAPKAHEAMETETATETATQTEKAGAAAATALSGDWNSNGDWDNQTAAALLAAYDAALEAPSVALAATPDNQTVAHADDAREIEPAAQTQSGLAADPLYADAAFGAHSATAGNDIKDEQSHGHDELTGPASLGAVGVLGMMGGDDAQVSGATNLVALDESTAQFEAEAGAETGEDTRLDTSGAHAALDGLCARVETLAKDVERAVAEHASKDDVRDLAVRFDQFETRLEEMRAAPLVGSATQADDPQIVGLVEQVEKIGAEASRIEVLEDALAQVIDEVTGLRGELPQMLNAAGETSPIGALGQDGNPLQERLDAVQEQVSALGNQLAQVADAVASNTQTLEATGGSHADGKLDHLQATLDQLAQRFSTFAAQVEVVDEASEQDTGDYRDAPMAPPLAPPLAPALAQQSAARVDDYFSAAPMPAQSAPQTSTHQTLDRNELYGQGTTQVADQVAHQETDRGTDQRSGGASDQEAARDTGPLETADPVPSQAAQEDRVAEKDAFIAAARRAAQVARERLGRSREKQEAEAQATATSDASVQSALARVLSPGAARGQESQPRVGDPTIAAAAASASKPKRRSLFSFGRTDPKPVLVMTAALLLAGGLGLVVANMGGGDSGTEPVALAKATSAVTSSVAEIGAAALPTDDDQTANAATAARRDDAAARDIADALNNAVPLSPAAYTANGEEVRTASVSAPTELDLPPSEAGSLKQRMAAANGDAGAQYDVAARLALIGRRKSKTANGAKFLKEATKWFRHAATADYAPAQYRLATHYERGLGVERNMNEARVWYGRAARNGNVRAMHNVAVLAASANEPADYGTAAEWFGKAAAYGLSDSQFNLAILQQAGLGLERDLHQAYQWFAIAARSGDREASRRRDLVRIGLDAQTLGKLEAKIAAWEPKPAPRQANRVPVVANTPKKAPTSAPANGGKLVSEQRAAPTGSVNTAIGTAPASTAQYQVPGVSPVLASFAQASGQIETIKTAANPATPVIRAQRALAALGFEPGPADGAWGERTARALRRFEAQRGLVPTGKLTPVLLKTLEIAAAA